MDGLNFVLLVRLTYRDIYMSRDNEMKSYRFNTSHCKFDHS